MTILALDIGDKRIGLAVSDQAENISFPLEVLHRTNLEKDCKHILSRAEEYHIRLIVAGLPRSLDGTLKAQADKVQRFVDALKSRTEIPLEYWNEWLTTKEAESSVLLQADVSRQKRRQVIDKLAASLILDGYLRRQQHRTETEGE
jgi:putative Holliday junction resolvase